MKRILAVAVAAILCGCVNIVGHVAGERPYRPYAGTKAMCGGIVEAFVEKPEWHWGCAGEAGMAHAYSALLFPVWVIGLPLEAVADTITLPYDLLKGM